MPMWWVSVADPALPIADQFLGVVITEAPTFVEAIQAATFLGLERGRATGGAVPDAYREAYRPYVDQILDRAAAERVSRLPPRLSS